MFNWLYLIILIFYASDMCFELAIYNYINILYFRYVCWNAYILRRASRGYVESVCLSNGPFSNYYAQESSDDGIIMLSEVPIKEVSKSILSN